MTNRSSRSSKRHSSTTPPTLVFHYQWAVLVLNGAVAAFHFLPSLHAARVVVGSRPPAPMALVGFGMALALPPNPCSHLPAHLASVPAKAAGLLRIVLQRTLVFF